MSSINDRPSSTNNNNNYPQRHSPLTQQEIEAAYELQNKLNVLQDEAMFDRIVEGVRIYEQVYGNTLIPKAFVVPTGQENIWGSSLSGVRLGKVTDHVRNRYRQGKLHPDQIKRLDEVDFAWVFNDYRWKRQIIPALETYKKLHNTMLIPRNYRVPVGDSKWPRQCWGRSLGKTVNNIRSRRKEISPEQVSKLNSMEFVWGVNEGWYQVTDEIKRQISDSTTELTSKPQDSEIKECAAKALEKLKQHQENQRKAAVDDDTVESPATTITADNDLIDNHHDSNPLDYFVNNDVSPLPYESFAMMPQQQQQQQPYQEYQYYNHQPPTMDPMQHFLATRPCYSNSQVPVVPSSCDDDTSDFQYWKSDVMQNVDGGSGDIMVGNFDGSGAAAAAAAAASKSCWEAAMHDAHQVFQNIYGRSVSVPLEFVVPADSNWPVDAWGMLLGKELLVYYSNYSSRYQQPSPPPPQYPTTLGEQDQSAYYYHHNNNGGGLPLYRGMENSLKRPLVVPAAAAPLPLPMEESSSSNKKSRNYDFTNDLSSAAAALEQELY